MITGKSFDPWIWAVNKKRRIKGNKSELVGKWLIFVEKEEQKQIDAWNKIYHATELGELGIVAKMSIGTNPYFNWKKHIICVYTANYKDEEDLWRVRKKLKELGFIEPLCYKTDQSTRASNYGHASHFICNK